MLGFSPVPSSWELPQIIFPPISHRNTCWITHSKIPYHHPCKLHFFFFLTRQLLWTLFWKVLALVIYSDDSSHPLLWTHFPSWLDMRLLLLFLSFPLWCGGGFPPKPLGYLYQGLQIVICLVPKAMHLILHLLTSGSDQGGPLFLSKRKWLKTLLSIFTFTL